MKKLLLALLLLLPFHLLPAHAESGIMTLAIPAPHQPHGLQAGIIFPSTGGDSISFGENPVFHGVLLHQHATLKPGKYPLILLSHGWGGNFTRMGWLSAGLAARGAIVLAVNHPGSTTGDISKTSALNHWTRAQDLSAALDYILKDPAFAASVDPARIYVTGFSYGGWTALSLGGLKGRAEGYALYCKAAGAGSTHCRDISNAGIDISKLDAEKWNASWKDKRIAAVAAIDPGLTWGIKPADTKGLDVPVMLISLGQGSDRLPATDTSAKGSNLDALLPQARIENISPAMHFSALGLCKPEGAAILAKEKDDPVCTDPAGSDRKAVMSRIIDLIAEQFHLN